MRSTRRSSRTTGMRGSLNFVAVLQSRSPSAVGVGNSSGPPSLDLLAEGPSLKQALLSVVSAIFGDVERAVGKGDGGQKTPQRRPPTCIV